MNREDRKILLWVGAARRELRGFPQHARGAAGKDLDRVQAGKDPADWKPTEIVGPGAREIRIRTFDGGAVQHRVIYVAKFPEAVYVLHAFDKKTAKRLRATFRSRPPDTGRCSNCAT